MIDSIYQTSFFVMIGICVGCAYTNGAALGQSLFSCCNYMLVILGQLVLVSNLMGWLKLNFACSVALGITLLVWCKIRLFRRPLPEQLRSSRLARPGEQEPDLFPGDGGGWDLVYPDGVIVSYDDAGQVTGVT